MNPTIDENLINDALRDDYASAKSEWLADWREDLELFLSIEMIDDAVVSKRIELPKQDDVQYFGFIDPSGGRHDSFALAICHKLEKGKVILDCIREAKAPLKPEEVISDFSAILKSYGVYCIGSDRYGAELIIRHHLKNMEYSLKIQSCLLLKSISTSSQCSQITMLDFWTIEG